MVAYQTVTGGEASKLLSIGKVLVNHVSEKAVTVQPYRSQLQGMIVAHKPQFQTRQGYSDEPSSDVAKERVVYDMIKFHVSLQKSGALDYDSIATMKKGRYAFKFSAADSINFIVKVSTYPPP